MNRKTGILGLGFTIALLLGVASVPAQEVEFNYNGRIKSGGLMFSGQGQFKFALVSKDGEAAFWTNDGLTTSTAMPMATVTVDVTDGFFSVNIGDAELPGMAVLTKDVFARDEDMYLRVWFNDGTRGFELLTPDRKITNTDLLGLKISKIKDYTIYVNGATGNDKHLGLTPAKPKKTIQSAIDTLPTQLKCNVTIDIADGVYREQVNIVGINAMPGKKLTLLGDDFWTTASVGDPAVRITGTDNDAEDHVFPRSNVIHAEQSSGFRIVGFFIDRALDARVSLASCSSWEVSRCRLTNGNDHTYGFSLNACGMGTISDCLINQNGVGIRSMSSAFAMTKVKVVQNYYGVYVDSTYVEVTDALVNNNGYAGMIIARSSNAEFSKQCQFSNNGSVTSGTGLEVTGNSALVVHGAGYGPLACQGEILNNNGYGLAVTTHSVVVGYDVLIISGNEKGDVRTFSGGSVYGSVYDP
jgi:hypothetical protein